VYPGGPHRLSRRQDSGNKPGVEILNVSYDSDAPSCMKIQQLLRKAWKQQERKTRSHHHAIPRRVWRTDTGDIDGLEGGMWRRSRSPRDVDAADNRGTPPLADWQEEVAQTTAPRKRHHRVYGTEGNPKEIQDGTIGFGRGSADHFPTPRPPAVRSGTTCGWG